MSEKTSQFEPNYGVVQAFGTIDGTHIYIPCPEVNSQDCFCYKQYRSINVQAVCDDKCLFMDVDCRWPGSKHDSKIYANSSIIRKMRNGELPTALQALNENTGYIHQFNW